MRNEKLCNARGHVDNADFEYIDTDDESWKSLTHVLCHRYEEHKTDYAFEGDKETVAGEPRLWYLREIHQCTKYDNRFCDNFHILRTFAKNEKRKSRDVLGKQMGHSQQAAMRNYNAILGPSVDESPALKHDGIRLTKNQKTLV